MTPADPPPPADPEPPLVLVPLTLSLPQYHARLPCPYCKTTARFEGRVREERDAGKLFKCYRCGALLGQYTLGNTGLTMVRVLSLTLDAAKG